MLCCALFVGTSAWAKTEDGEAAAKSEPVSANEEELLNKILSKLPKVSGYIQTGYNYGDKNGDNRSSFQLKRMRVLLDKKISNTFDFRAQFECFSGSTDGGATGYINHWNPKVDLKTNICRQILSRNGYMYNKAENIIGASLRELSVYDTILACIAGGCDKLNDLYLKTGFSRAKISVYMKNLAASDIIEKAVSFETGGWENAKKGVYRIRDNYVNFWFRFIYPHLSALYMMSAEEFYDTYIEPGLNTYLNRYFVGVCMEYLWLLNLTGKLPLHIKKMGTWIGKTGNIDIIAQNEVRENLVGLCNWEKPQVTMEMCEELFANMKKAKISANYYFLFSASTFEQAVVEMAEQDKRFVLIDMSEL